LVSFHLAGQCGTKTQATSTHHLGFLYGIWPKNETANSHERPV
jgi:hypothetical protein